MGTKSLDIWRRFKALDGSEQISSPFALAGLSWWLDHRRPSLVLEIGGGIGAASELLRRWAENRPCQIIVVEDDPWCLEQWRRNLPPSLEVRLAVAPPPWTWDFVVLDGPQVPPGLWERGLAIGATIFIEGGRREQRREIREALQKAGRRACWASWRPADRSKGYWVGTLEPCLPERLGFAWVRLREWGRDLPARWRGQPIGKKACGSG